MAVAKSPLTGGWEKLIRADSSGPTSSSPVGRGILHRDFTQAVFLLLDDGKAELKDAAYLWGKDSYETEDILMAEYKGSR